jgi:hypothetical protein
MILRGILGTLLLLLPHLFVMGAHDSLNVILAPGGRECFFDDIPDGAPVRSIEVFVPSGANVDVLLEVNNCVEI